MKHRTKLYYRLQHTWPFLEITQRESPAFATISWLFLIIATHAVLPDVGPLKSEWGPWTQGREPLIAYRYQIGSTVKWEIFLLYIISTKSIYIILLVNTNLSEISSSIAISSNFCCKFYYYGLKPRKFLKYNSINRKKNWLFSWENKLQQRGWEEEKKMENRKE